MYISVFSSTEIIFSAEKETRQETIVLAEILKDIDRKQLKGILINQGPGRFISLRVGTAYAISLGFSLKIPVHAVSLFAYFQKSMNHLDMVEKCDLVYQTGMSTLITPSGELSFETLPACVYGAIRSEDKIPEKTYFIPWKNNLIASDFCDLWKESSADIFPLLYGKAAY